MASSRSATSTSRRASRARCAATEAMYLLMANAFRAGIPPLRVEMRQLQSAVARRGHAFRLHLRRPVSPGHRQQGPQSRHHLVRHHRSRLERRTPGRLSTLARPGEFRCGRHAEAAGFPELTAPFVHGSESCDRQKNSASLPASDLRRASRISSSSASTGCLTSCRRSARHSAAAALQMPARRAPGPRGFLAGASPAGTVLRTTFGRVDGELDRHRGAGMHA